MRLFGLFADREKAVADRLYAELVRQARRAEFYAELGVPDTLDGRFELVVLHAFLVLHRLKGESEEAGAVGRALLEAMFADLDASLREMGVGDLGVAPRMKKMASAFYGRAAAYERALRDGNTKEAVRRNLFGTTVATDAQLGAVAGYVERMSGELAARPVDSLLSQGIRFSSPPMALQAH